MNILNNLCNDLLLIIPEGHDVRAAIKWTQAKLAFAAPELEGMHWRTLVQALGEIDPDEPWHRTTVEAFANASNARTAESRAEVTRKP